MNCLFYSKLICIWNLISRESIKSAGTALLKVLVMFFYLEESLSAMIFQTGLIPLIIIYRDISETDWFAICGSLSKFIFRIVRIGLSQMVVNRMGVPQEVELGSLLFLLFTVHGYF